MSAPIGPGDWVECVGGSYSGQGWPLASGEKPERGRIYRVDRVSTAEGMDGQSRPALTLVSPKAFSPRGREAGWPVGAFRPVYRPKSEIIQSLLQPAPVREFEDA